MYANGFFEERRRSPASLATVITLHAAAVGALVLYGTTTFVRDPETITKVFNVPIPADPPPEPLPTPRPDEPVQQHRSQLDRVPETPPIGDGPVVAGPSTPPQASTGPVGPQNIELTMDTTPRIPDPVRIAARVDPNYADALQPPYPRSMEDQQRSGRVRVRITIGANGRVIGIERLSSDSDAFWQATERQARNRWRFRPATVDGRPIESTMVMTVTFRIPDA